MKQLELLLQSQIMGHKYSVFPKWGRSSMRRLMLITSQLQYQFSLFPTCSVFNSQKLLSTTGAVPSCENLFSFQDVRPLRFRLECGFKSKNDLKWSGDENIVSAISLDLFFSYPASKLRFSGWKWFYTTQSMSYNAGDTMDPLETHRCWWHSTLTLYRGGGGYRELLAFWQEPSFMDSSTQTWILTLPPNLGTCHQNQQVNTPPPGSLRSLSVSTRITNNQTHYCSVRIRTINTLMGRTERIQLWQGRGTFFMKLRRKYFKSSWLLLKAA